MSRTFPDLTDYRKLTTASDAEVAAIWRALTETDKARHCCAFHGDRIPDRTADDEDWEQAVYSEMERRQLPTKQPAEPLVCDDCHGELECVIDPDWAMDAYFVCRRCRTRRKGGDHMNCRMGATEPLPEGW